MNNLKVSKNVKVLVLAGASIVLMGTAGFGFNDNNVKADNNSNVVETYLNIENSTDIDIDEVLSFNKYLRENDLIPYKNSIDILNLYLLVMDIMLKRLYMILILIKLNGNLLLQRK